MKKVKMTMTHKKDNKSFIYWWFKKNWQTLLVLFLEWIIIGAMIADCILWLSE